MTVSQISPIELKHKLDAGEDLELIDVREKNEKEIADIGGNLIPLKTVGERAGEIPRNKTVVIYCRSGGRSTKAIEELQARHGFTNLINLKGGILGWADQVDPNLTKY